MGSYLIVQEGWINVEGTFHAFLSKKPAMAAKLVYRFSNARQAIPSSQEYVSTLRNNVFVHHNLKYGLPFADQSVDFVYASHVLEHFYPKVARRLLREAKRVLKPGGYIRVCVPDLQHAFDLYRSGKKEEALEYFFQDEHTAEFHRHKYMYDFEILRSLLEESGFSGVQRCEFRQGRTPDIDKLDNRPHETLFVEAVNFDRRLQLPSNAEQPKSEDAAIVTHSN